MSKRKFKIKVKAAKPRRVYETTIGLEVHTHLNTSSKLFCACCTDFGAEPNANTCPVCTAMPGSLPVINREAVAMGVRAAIALNLDVNPTSVFARKNYFYPDLPKGYQISQYDKPLASEGYLDIVVAGEEKRIGIERAHMEEDAGKLVHAGADGIAGSTGSLVDMNRAGTPLLEIVSKPEIESPDQAVEYLRSLRETLIFAGAIRGHMEEGGLRCDANISIRPQGQEELGVKVEIKNLNSFKFLKRALECEVARQKEVLSAGGELVQETRGYDPERDDTFSMRKKEEAHDYRYFPEPDLLPLEVSDEMVAEVQRSMPELPREKRQKYAEWDLAEEQTDLLLKDIVQANLFEECVQSGDLAPKDFAKWFLNDFAGEVNSSDEILETVNATPDRIVEIYALRSKGELSEKALKRVIQRCISEDISPDRVIEEEDLAPIQDTGFVESAIEEVIADNEDQVADYRAGSGKILNYLIGQTMRRLKGKADVKVVTDLLHRKLDS